MKKAIVTGGAGFAGFSLVRQLLFGSCRVVCPVKPDSPHNLRLDALKKEDDLLIIPLDMSMIRDLPGILKEKGVDMTGCLFFHLAWSGERDSYEQQIANITPALDVVRAAKEIGASKIILTGSQAEYGLKASGTLLPDGSYKPVSEDESPAPVNSYGAAKTACMYLTRDLARHLGLKWNWLRIFSLYGEYEHPHTMLSYLRDCLKNNETAHLSSCSQTWDYLHTNDAAKAIIAVGERGVDNGIYNIASGNFRPLKEYVEIIRRAFDPGAEIFYAPEDPDAPALSLRPDVSRLRSDTGWEPETYFS